MVNLQRSGLLVRGDILSDVRKGINWLHLVQYNWQLITWELPWLHAQVTLLIREVWFFFVDRLVRRTERRSTSTLQTMYWYRVLSTKCSSALTSLVHLTFDVNSQTWPPVNKANYLKHSKSARSRSFSSSFLVDNCPRLSRTFGL